MRQRLKGVVLKFLKVPHEPEPPAGSPGSIQIFRAARNFYKLCLIKWALKQLAALVLLALVLFLFHLFGGYMQLFHGHFSVEAVVVGIHLLGVCGYLLTMPFTYAMVWLDYELRWYIVTDRSLRIRSGLWKVREMTMTFANIQQITVQQGPLQRLLGIADLEVSTAGGGASARTGPHGEPLMGESLHSGYFHGIDNAERIRDMMLERLRRLRDPGLGDPDEAHHEAAAPAGDNPLMVAALELLSEARALRKAGLPG